MIKQVFNSVNVLEDVIALYNTLSTIHVECFEKFTTKELTYKITIQSIICDAVVPYVTTKIVDKLKERDDVIKSLDVNNKNRFSLIYITFNPEYNFVDYVNILTHDLSSIDTDLFI